MTTILLVQSFASLPTCTQVPSSGSQLVNKTFTDATYATLSGSITLSGTNAWTGTNTYNTNLPTSTLTPTTGTQLVTKTFTDATYATISGSPTLSGANVWTGNTNTFNSFLPTSTLTPTTSVQFTPKAFTDATYGALTGVNTWTAQNGFSLNPLFPTGATVSYVPTCTNATTGAWTWQAVASSSSATVTTTDATPTTLVSVALTNGTSVTLNGFISARNSAFTDASGGRFNAVAITTSGGVSTLVGAQPDVVTSQTSTATFNVIVTGNNLIVQVTGIAATTYVWKASYTTLVN